MEITALNKHCNTDPASKKAGAKYNSNAQTDITEAFEKEVLNWEGKMKEKINKDFENDNEKNIMMSEKQWHALMKKVDSAIKTQSQYVKENAKNDCSKSDDEGKRLYEDSF